LPINRKVYGVDSTGRQLNDIVFYDCPAGIVYVREVKFEAATATGTGNHT